MDITCKCECIRISCICCKISCRKILQKWNFLENFMTRNQCFFTVYYKLLYVYYSNDATSWLIGDGTLQGVNCQHGFYVSQVHRWQNTKIWNHNLIRSRLHPVGDHRLSDSAQTHLIYFNKNRITRYPISKKDDFESPGLGVFTWTLHMLPSVSRMYSTVKNCVKQAVNVFKV